MKQSKKHTPIRPVVDARTKDTSGLSFGGGLLRTAVVKVSSKEDARTKDVSTLKFGAGYLPASVAGK